MRNDDAQAAEGTLERAAIHQEWVDNYRTPDNEHFYNMAFDFIAASFAAPPDAVVLDAGCGSCAKSRNLVDRGFKVVGSDLSSSALEFAREALRGTPYEASIDLRQENLTHLSFPDGEFKYAVCWGVLMHVPEVDKAIAELSRVVAPGGYLAISEGNMKSWQTQILRFLKRILKREHAEVKLTPAGIENWEETDDGRLMTRQADIDWLVREFRHHGLELQRRVPGQFSELYWVFKSPWLKKLIHGFNYAWFRFVRWPGPAFGNILIFRRPERR